MKCLNCGHKMKASVGPYKYSECGLDGVTLVDVDVRQCSACGETEVSIPRIEELHKTIALIIARKDSRLSPKEIRFLRTYLGYSSVDFANRIGVSAEQVSRWENGKNSMQKPTELLVRLLVLSEKPLDSYSFVELGEASPKKLPMRLERAGKGWHSDLIAETA